MNDEDEKAIVQLMREAIEKSRGYANFFGWAPNRDLEEVGVIQSLAEAMEIEGNLFFSKIAGRARPNDPPDCEALSHNGERIAIEVTELVDGAAIESFKAGRVYDWAEWDRQKFISGVARALAKKDSRFPHLKDPPYPGGYVVVIHSDEPALNYMQVHQFLEDHLFERPKYINRAFLILGYDPRVQYCPFFELALNG